MVRAVFSTLASLLQVVWPVCCPVCGRLGTYVCDCCLRTLGEVLPPYCLECGSDLPCSRHEGAPVCYAASRYGGTNREIVHAMKYASAREVAEKMGRLLAERFPCPKAEFLVPVPLHKRSDRDYNQAELIAAAAARIWDIPVKPILYWRTDVPKQARQQASGRGIDLDSMAAVREIPSAASVFLVDDVYTTGNTLKTARRALERQNLKVMGAFVWARSGEPYRAYA